MQDEPCASDQTQRVEALDPNEKVGPSGYLRPGQEIAYTIYFENLPFATAAAQEVVVTDELDSDLDWGTFQLGEVSFGDKVVTSFAGKTIGFERVAYQQYWVEITGEQIGRMIRWDLKMIDPATGELPDDPEAGFLPPEDGTGRGEGHVTFFITVAGSAPSATQIANEAVIKGTILTCI